MNDVINTKQERILDAAVRLFLKYGYKRVTMGDIAEASEMSRPAVYLEYANKVEIFRAGILLYMERFREMAAEGLKEWRTLEERLGGVLRYWVLDPFRLMHESPLADDLYESSYSFANDLRMEGMSWSEVQICDAIEGAEDLHLESLKSLDMTIQQVGRLINLSTAEMKRFVQKEEDLQEHLDSMVKVYTRLLTVEAAVPSESST